MGVSRKRECSSTECAASGIVGPAASVKPSQAVHGPIGMTDLTLPTRAMPNPFNPLRLAWRARNAWHRVARPLTMGVRAIVLDGDSVLLIRHSYVPGWHLPGGGVDKGETLVEAMKREVREEVGLHIECKAQPLGMYARFRSGASDHVALFVADSWRGVPRADGFEILEAAFFPLDRLPEETTPATRRRLAEYRGLEPLAERW